MGWRRPGQRVAAHLLVALVVLSGIVASPSGRTAGGASGTEVVPVPVPQAAGVSTESPGGGPEGLLGADEGVVAEYPSSWASQSQGDPIGPEPTLANAIDNHHFDDAWALGYRGSGVQVAVVDEGVDFGHLDLQGTQATVTDPTSPYFGWPIVYDPRSLATYLRTGWPDTTYYANTTRVGAGPFEVAHTIKVDGTKDFGDRERWAADSRDKTAGVGKGNKLDYDLTDLYATRDDANWFIGFPLYLNTQNASFMLLIDVDNETSGANVAPLGNVDTNTSHAGKVYDVAWSPDGTKVATVAGDRYVRIWDRSGVLLRTLAGHTDEVMSAQWTPDGTKLVSADKTWFRLWDAVAGTLIRATQYVGFGDTSIQENRILSISPNGTWVALATYKYVHIFNLVTGARFGSLWAENTEVNAVAFNPQNGAQIAVGLGNNAIVMYTINATNVQPPPPATKAKPLCTFAGHTQPVLEIAWSPDGTKLVSGAKDNTAKLWDVATQTVIKSMPDHQSWVLAASWSPSGTEFVTSSRGLAPAVAPSFAVWDSAGNRQAFVTQSKSMTSVDWSSLGELATGSEDLTARLWTTAGAPRRILVAHRPDYAMYVHGFSRYSDRESKYVHGAELATWYRWDAPNATWNATPLATLGGRQAGMQFGEQLFNEFSFPRSLIGDPSAISISLFSMHENGSRAQDTVPTDLNVNFQDLDFTPGWSSLSAFAWREIQLYQVSGITSLSGKFHFGFHPAPTVQRKYGALGLLVVDGAVSGEYDRVVLDMNDDKVFDATDVVVSKASPIAAIDAYDSSGNAGQDGYPDISAGMVYFISDSTHPIPYSERLLSRRSDLTMRIPPAGDLVAFAGEFGIDPLTTVLSEHGTRIASAIVAQGRLPTPLVGTANAAKIITIMNGPSDPVEAWWFAVEGYDGNPTRGGDQAQVVVSAFNFPTLHHDGWDVYSRTADYLSTQRSGGSAVFVASAGDYGFGYGTVLSPASGPSVIAAGRAGDFSLRTIAAGGAEGPNPQVRNPAVPGSRGPSAQGFVKPELLAVDTTTVAVPLHSASDGSSAVSSTPMVGSDVSAALVAGAAVLVYEAFTATRGRTPNVEEVRTILMSGADDTGHDVLTQGAGFLNVSRSIRLAAQRPDAGLEVSPATWHPGTYRNAALPGFTRLMYPGGTEGLLLSLQNRGTTPITASVEPVVYAKIGEYVHTNLTRKDMYSPTGSIVLWVNDTGLWKVNGTTLAVVQMQAPIAGMWADAELVKVTAYGDLSRITYKSENNFYANYSYTLKAYDWTIDWANWLPGVGPFPMPSFLMNELNTIGETFHQSNVLEVRAAFPATELHDGLAVNLDPVDVSLGVDNLPWTFVFEFYSRVAWPWTTATPSSLTVPANSSRTVDVNLTVPAIAGMGSYEAALLVEDLTNGLTTTVPVLVNVGTRGPLITFGGDPLSSDLYDNNRLFGGYDRTLLSPTALRRPVLGDWRFYFFDVPSEGMFDDSSAPLYGFRVMVRTDWVGAPSDIDTFAFGRTTADEATRGNGSWYGPFPLKQSGKSEELSKPEFKTASNGPAELISYNLASGLNVIALRAFALRGFETSARLSGQAGWVNAPSTLDVATRSRSGEAPFSVLSNLDLPALRVSAVGPAQTTAFTDVPVKQDVQAWWNFPGWGEWMYRAQFTYIINVEKALILDVHVEGKTDVGDLDMAVFRNYLGKPCVWDPNLIDNLTHLPGYWKDCEIDPEEYNVIDCTGSGGLCLGSDKWNYNADSDSDEQVKWTNPPDGQYLIKVLGYTVYADPGHFDMQISVTLATGEGYMIKESPKPAEIVNGTTPLPAFTRVPLNMTWNFPIDTKDDAYGGGILVGYPDAPGAIVVPVTVTLDRAPPVMADFRVNALNGRLNEADNRTTNDAQPTLVVSVRDYDRGQLVASTAHISLDETDLTPVSVIGITFTTRNNKVGFWEGTIALTPPSPLGEGTHSVQASVRDRAGNIGIGNYTFVIDRTGPILVLNGPLRQFTTLDTYTVSGTAEPGTSVNVRGTWYVVGPSGTFSVPVSLLNGTNMLSVTAADWFDLDAGGNPIPGNAVTAVQTVIRDLVDPEFSRFGTDPGGLTREDATVVSGTVEDMYSAFEAGSPQDLALTVNGLGVPILVDGSFQVVVPLQEGANAIDATVTDAAGNTASASASVNRDTTAPALAASAHPGTTVQTQQVTIQGTAEVGAFVTVNGISVPSPNGAFSKPLILSAGRNTIVVQARDRAGNVAEQVLVVTYDTGGGASTALSVVMLALGIILGAFLAFLLVRRRRPAEGAPEEASPEEEAPLEEAPPETAEGGEAVPEESGAEEPEDPRVARLRKAYEEGRISEEVYEENLRRLGG